jgi:hypothetical protein
LSNLISLSNWLSRLGRREDAQAAIEEAVTAYRELASARPAVYATRLKSSLTVMANALAAVGREAESDAVRTEVDRLS